MHQLLCRPGQEPVIDEKILLHVQVWVASLEIARAVAKHPVTQRQILSACRRPDRIGLHETEF